MLAAALRPHKVRVAKINVMKDSLVDRLGIPLDGAARSKLSFPLFKIIQKREGVKFPVMHGFPASTAATYDALLEFASGGWRKVQGMSVGPAAQAPKREDPMKKLANLKMPDLSHLKDQIESFQAANPAQGKTEL